MSADIILSECTDLEAVRETYRAAKVLALAGNTAICLLTSTCPENGHGNHVSCCVMGKNGKMTPGETRAAVKRLRSLADELESKFAPPGSAD